MPRSSKQRVAVSESASSTSSKTLETEEQSLSDGSDSSIVTDNTNDDDSSIVSGSEDDFDVDGCLDYTCGFMDSVPPFKEKPVSYKDKPSLLTFAKGDDTTYSSQLQKRRTKTRDGRYLSKFSPAKEETLPTPVDRDTTAVVQHVSQNNTNHDNDHHTNASTAEESTQDMKKRYIQNVAERRSSRRTKESSQRDDTSRRKEKEHEEKRSKRLESDEKEKATRKKEREAKDRRESRRREGEVKEREKREDRVSRKKETEHRERVPRSSREGDSSVRKSSRSSHARVHKVAPSYRIDDDTPRAGNTEPKKQRSRGAGILMEEH
jgi:hypothetical protein